MSAVFRCFILTYVQLGWLGSKAVVYDHSVISAEFLTCSSKVPLLQSVMHCDPFTVTVSSQEQNSWDPSTLLAALSQASAVLVAIIGGFLVSRLVAISSEREGIRRLVEAAAGRINHVESDLKDARQTRLERAERYFYEEAVDKFLENPSLDLDELIHDRVTRGTTEEELKPYAVSLQQRTTDAVKRVKERLRRGDTKNLKLEELINRGLVIEDADLDLYEHVFKHQRDRLPSPTALSMLGAGGFYDVSKLAAGIRPDWAYAADLRRHDEEIRAESDLRAQLRSAIAERDRLNDELVRVGKPVGVAAAIWMLGLLSLGILVPVAMMAFEPKGLDILSKIGLIISFIIGLVAILWYVGWFWKKIGTDETQSTAGNT